MFRTVYRSLFVALGLISLALGIIGIFLPLLPTTPFLLLAAFCFSKGSKRLHAWLLASPYLGQIIRDWERYGTISPRAKIACAVLMVLFIGYPVLFVDVKWFVKVMVVAIGASSLTFVLTRPSRKPDQAPEETPLGPLEPALAVALDPGAPAVPLTEPRLDEPAASPSTSSR